MNQGREDALDIFVSYAHEDEELCDELRKRLTMLEREGKIRSWHDRGIRAGEDWASIIDQHLNAADVILLLISPDFMASEYCYDIELRRAVERHKAGGVQLLPIILRPTDWQRGPFADIQVLPKDARPVTSWPDQDEALLNIQKGIRATIEEELRRRRDDWRNSRRPSPTPPADLARPSPPPAPSNVRQDHKEPEEKTPSAPQTLAWLPAPLRSNPLRAGIAGLAAVLFLALALTWIGGSKSPNEGFMAIGAPYKNLTSDGRSPLRGHKLRIKGAVDVYTLDDRGVAKSIGKWEAGTQVRVEGTQMGNARGGQWLKCRKI